MVEVVGKLAFRRQCLRRFFRTTAGMTLEKLVKKQNQRDEPFQPMKSSTNQNMYPVEQPNIEPEDDEDGTIPPAK